MNHRMKGRKAWWDGEAQEQDNLAELSRRVKIMTKDKITIDLKVFVLPTSILFDTGV